AGTAMRRSPTTSGWRATRCVSANPAASTTDMRFGALFSAALLSILAFSKDPPRAELTLKNNEGQRVRLSDLRGKPVVLNFWATWCQPCNAEMPLLVKAESDYHERVLFIAASLDDSKTKAAIPAFLTRYNVLFPVWTGATPDDLDRLQLAPAV